MMFRRYGFIGASQPISECIRSCKYSHLHTTRFQVIFQFFTFHDSCLLIFKGAVCHLSKLPKTCSNKDISKLKKKNKNPVIYKKVTAW